MGLVGASAALAGLEGGCERKPVEKIVPFAERPEDLVPGRPAYYATAFQVGGTVQGLLVESHDGRPIKVEGNPKHPGSQGGSDVWAQASVLGLYDPERSRTPYRQDEPSTWEAALAAIDDLLAQASSSEGEGLGLVVDHVLSPSYRRQLRELRVRFPKARVFIDDPVTPANAIAAAELVSGKGARVTHHLDFERIAQVQRSPRIQVVVAVDSDFLGTEADHVRLSREWARMRRISGPDEAMSRLYVVEPHLTCTGMAADHRVRMRSGTIGPFMRALAAELRAKHEPALVGGRSARRSDGLSPAVAAVFEAIGGESLGEAEDAVVAAIAKDLADWRGRSAVLVGERQPAWVHAIGIFLNTVLGNSGGAQRWITDIDAVEAEPLSALAAALGAGELVTLLCLGTNPVYDAPGGLQLAAGLDSLQTLVHAGLYRDETAQRANWHLPLSHFLEAWGDLRAQNGTVSLCQPLIAPLHETRSALELAGYLASGKMVDGYDLVRSHWQQEGGGELSEPRWRRWLHDGMVTGMPRHPKLPSMRPWDDVVDAVREVPTDPEGIEVDFHPSPALCDGRYSNNAWLQELPHPMTKLCWDNAAYLSVATARSLGIDNGDLVEIELEGRSVTIAAWVAPGQADDTVSVDLGYGREGVGSVAAEAGTNVNELRGANGGWFAGGATVRKTGGTYPLVSTQDHGTMDEGFGAGRSRAIVREATFEEFQGDPEFARRGERLRPDQRESLFAPPGNPGRQQWGMSIDLNACTGCNACVIACQAENNIPVVGKEEVRKGREMHWVRIDRYYSGDLEDPRAAVQPMPCQHCENAPCETVCPVAAAVHSPEGLSDMAYSRCIGTRYCANNCAYKVRRFNFFNLNLDVDEISRMAKNPDVTVRSRGVMEKCSYCVQRINAAKIAAKVAGKDVVPDGTIKMACAQACPTQAIVFGDIRDPKSAVSLRKARSRDYAVLADLNNHPRTTYLARIRNRNPKLA
jgi:molybdopterin-containing oxidoreductase family iron-sulfur binding subunit